MKNSKDLGRQGILAAIDKLIGPIRTQGGIQTPPAEPVPAELIALESRAMKFALSAEQQAEAHQIVGEYEVLRDQMRQYGQDFVPAAFEAHLRELSHGELAGKPTADAWTKEDFRRDFARRSATLKGDCRKLSQAAGKLIAKAIAPLVARLRERAQQLAVEEFRAHAAVGCDYAPSRMVKAYRGAADSLLWRAAKWSDPDTSGSGPRQMFAEIGIDLA